MWRAILHLILVLLLAIASSASAQRIVTGRLVDKETGKPVKDAVIAQLGTDVTTKSNAFGFFQLQVDSLVSIEIVAADYPKMQVQLPDVASFKIELVKSPVLDVDFPKRSDVYEEPASFPGGMQSFYKYLADNIRYPNEVKNGKPGGRVMVEFFVDSTGRIPTDSIRIKKAACKPCNEEAIRLVKGSPQWKPGRQGGKAVGQKMILPIQFGQ